MNKIFTFFLLFICLNTFAQKDFATIYIYRPSTMVGSMVTDHIHFNSKKVCEIKNGGYLEYKVFTENTIIISVYGTALGTESDKLSQVSLNVEKGQIYYFKIFPKFGRIGIEQLTEPVKESKLNPKKFISLTDIGTIYENAKPDTDWTYNKLIEHWTKNGITSIEGIYEKSSAMLEYKLAVLKENNEYKIIYLAGANGTSWREGDIKATLKKTADPTLFKSNWKMLNKSNNKDVVIKIYSSTLQTISEAGNKNAEDIYIKMYPTYEDSSKSGSSLTNTWKSTGTGFFIDKKGYLATNHHVIEEAKEIEITYNNKNYFAKVVISDKQNDLAILKIIDDKFIPLNSINYNFELKTTEVGKSVIALGFPETQLMGEELKLTSGIINSKTGFKGDISCYQISATLQHGNSGGPLFDDQGNLIGITSSGIKREDIENVNYAIKTKYLKLLIDELDEQLQLPNTQLEKNNSLEKKFEVLKNYVVYIKVK